MRRLYYYTLALVGLAFATWFYSVFFWQIPLRAWEDCGGVNDGTWLCIASQHIGAVALGFILFCLRMSRDFLGWAREKPSETPEKSLSETLKGTKFPLSI